MTKDASKEDGYGGVLNATSAFLLWGLFPLYWPLLEPSGSLEVLAHRVLWSLVVVVVLLAVTGRSASTRARSCLPWPRYPPWCSTAATTAPSPRCRSCCGRRWRSEARRTNDECLRNDE